MIKPPRNPKNPYGTESALALKSFADRNIDLSYWDLWMILAARQESDGDLESLAQILRRRLTSESFGREEIRAKLSHLRDLQGRLRDAGVDESAVLAEAGPLAPSEKRRAWNKVLGKTARRSEWSEAMRLTPEDRGTDLALRGLWDRFPVSPKAAADEIMSHFRTTGYYSEDQSFSISRRLDRYVEKAEGLAAQGRHAEAMALLRAVLTSTIEVLGYADDSCGVIGDSFQSAFKAYLKIPRDKAGIDEALFLQDLLTLLVWEDYGLTWGQTHGIFRKLSSEMARFCLDFTRDMISRLRADDLDYQAEKALTLLGQVAGEQRAWELFEPLAREMGSREWERILRLSDSAIKARKRELAHRVFKAALQPGMHRDFLLKHYGRMKRCSWKPEFKS